MRAKTLDARPIKTLLDKKLFFPAHLALLPSSSSYRRSNDFSNILTNIKKILREGKSKNLSNLNTMMTVTKSA